MHLIEKGILNSSMSAFMRISCTTDNLQFKNTDYLGRKKKKKESLADDPCVQITFRKQRAGAGQVPPWILEHTPGPGAVPAVCEVLWGTKEVLGTGQCQAGIGTRLLLFVFK